MNARIKVVNHARTASILRFLFVSVVTWRKKAMVKGRGETELPPLQLSVKGPRANTLRK